MAFLTQRQVQCLVLIGRGYNQHQIATILHVSQPTISREVTRSLRLCKRLKRFREGNGKVPTCDPALLDKLGPDQIVAVL